MFERGSQRQYLVAIPTVDRIDRDYLRPAVCQRASLVECDLPHAGQRFQCAATFEQHAHPRRSTQGRDDGNRSRDHQRAGTGHDEQNQRPVDPFGITRNEPTSERERDRTDHYRRGIDCREPLDQRLHRRLRLMRSFNQVNDPADRRI